MRLIIIPIKGLCLLTLTLLLCCGCSTITTGPAQTPSLYTPSPAAAASAIPSPVAISFYVSTEQLPVYAQADLSSTTIACFTFSQEVLVLPYNQNFSKVILHDGREGYVSSAALSSEQPTPAPSAQKPSATPLPTLNPGQKLVSARIRIYKSERRLELYDADTLAAVYPIALGWEPTSHKEAEGDGRTPEGEYYICTRNPNSSYYLSLGLSYPNEQDALAALKAGRIDESTYDSIASAISAGQRPPWNTPLGGAIMIHGCGSARDWTAGCVAVENEHMDILWENCPIGTPVYIFP